MSIEQQILAIGKKARAAAVYMAKANTHAKNAALLETAKLIRANKAQLTQAMDATKANLSAINDALNSTPVNGAATDTMLEIQSVVTGYAAILASADGVNNNATNPTQTHYTSIGVTGVDSLVEVSLLGDAIDLKLSTAVDQVSEVQALANAVAAVMTGAAAGTAPTLDQLLALGVTGVTASNLSSVQTAIAGTADNGTGVDTLAKIQALVPVSLPDNLNLGTVTTVNLNLINKVTMANGKVYYFLDISADGTAGTTDRITHVRLDNLLNGSADTVDTQTTGAVKGVDDERTVLVNGYTLVLPTMTELLELYSDPLSNPPPGWYSASYWSATRSSANIHGEVSLVSSFQDPTEADITLLHVAFQVL